MFELVTYPGTNDTIRGIIVTALRKLAAKSFLDICIITGLAELMGVTLSDDAMVILRLLHCTQYKAIDPAAMEWLNNLLTEILKGKDV